MDLFHKICSSDHCLHEIVPPVVRQCYDMCKRFSGFCVLIFAVSNRCQFGRCVCVVTQDKAAGLTLQLVKAVTKSPRTGYTPVAVDGR